MNLKNLFSALIFFSTTIYGQNHFWPYGRIHCLGDSHCAHFFTNCKTFQEYVDLKIESATNSKDPEFQYEKSTYHFHIGKCVIVAVIPPMHPNHILEANDHLYLASTPLAERVVFTEKLNHKLSVECEQNNILFLSLPDVLKNSNGTFNLFYADSGEHIHPK